MDLNVLLDTIAPKVDRRFTKSISYNNLSVLCDIPTIDTEYQIYSFGSLINADEKSLDFSLNNYIISHVVDLLIEGKDIGFRGLNYQERLYLLNKLPAGMFHSIRNNFIKEIHDSVTEIDFLTMQCKDCKEKMEIRFDINNINDILKIIYKDNSLESFLQTLASISSTVHMSAEFLKTITPIEISAIYKFIERQNKEQEQTNPTQQPKEKDMFEEYRAQTAGMAESPSEFTL